MYSDIERQFKFYSCSNSQCVSPSRKQSVVMHGLIMVAVQ